MKSISQSRYSESALNDKARLERIADTTLKLDDLFAREVVHVLREADAADYTSVEELKLLKELKAQAAATNSLMTKLATYLALRQGHLPHGSVKPTIDPDEEAAALLRVEQAVERMRAGRLQ